MKRGGCSASSQPCRPIVSLPLKYTLLEYCHDYKQDNSSTLLTNYLSIQITWTHFRPSTCLRIFHQSCALRSGTAPFQNPASCRSATTAPPNNTRLPLLHHPFFTPAQNRAQSFSQYIRTSSSPRNTRLRYSSTSQAIQSSSTA